MRYWLPSGISLHHSQEDPAAMLEIKEDIRDECAKVGTVTNVVLYDQEPDGVASVRYSTVESANACVRVRASLPIVELLSASPSYHPLFLSTSYPTSFRPQTHKTHPHSDAPLRSNRSPIRR